MIETMHMTLAILFLFFALGKYVLNRKWEFEAFLCLFNLIAASVPQ